MKGRRAVKGEGFLERVCHGGGGSVKGGTAVKGGVVQGIP